MAKTPEQAQAVLRRLRSELEHPAELEHKFAEAILNQAVQNAASRPTPQAPMAAGALRVEGSAIRSLAGGAPEAVAQGAEFGSDIYLQFHKPSNPQGYWLYPAAESQQFESAGDKALEDVLKRAVSLG